MCVHTHGCVEVRGQVLEDTVLFPSCGFWRIRLRLPALTVTAFTLSSFCLALRLFLYNYRWFFLFINFQIVYLPKLKSHGSSSCDWWNQGSAKACWAFCWRFWMFSYWGLILVDWIKPCCELDSCASVMSKWSLLSVFRAKVLVLEGSGPSRRLSFSWR